MRLEQKTALNAKIEKFITAKTSGNALKQGSRTDSVFRQLNSQLQKTQYKQGRSSALHPEYKAAHDNTGVKHTKHHDRTVYNCENIRPGECFVK